MSPNEVNAKSRTTKVRNKWNCIKRGKGKGGEGKRKLNQRSARVEDFDATAAAFAIINNIRLGYKNEEYYNHIIAKVKCRTVMAQTHTHRAKHKLFRIQTHSNQTDCRANDKAAKQKEEEEEK